MPKIPIILNYTDLQQQIALTLLKGAGRKKIRLILSNVGSVNAFFKEKKYKLLKINGLGRSFLDQLNREEALLMAEKHVVELLKKPFQAHFFQDDDFPQRLNQCEDAPLLLFSQGNMDLNASRVVSIVGTRNATAYGKSICDELLHAFVGKNIVVVSGLAYGIDIYVHQLCVKLGIPTIGVLGHGLDRLYPATHKQTAKAMQANGGLLTEFLPGTNLDRVNFPMRNRIVAGMCDATIVVESGEKGGSLITAELANDYARDVFAFPGDIGKEFSMGCNKLIQQNRAHLITCSADFFRLMNWNEVEKKAVKQTQLFEFDLSVEELSILQMLKDKESESFDLLSLKLDLSVSKLSGMLLNLEFEGLVKSLPGKRYRLTM